ncbi:class I SAM-dependent methyltransferase [Desulfurivibrio sp. D14AmB]|uniref:class I SAM-dependent methyltransferase n=1 Tax=Desulfurivibrio sp. D14AmB TaxID=3374370 RepID=UPI00376F18FA
MKTDLFDGTTKKIMLHIAPEKFLAGKFCEINNLDYLSADLSSPRAMVKMDITAINYPANSFSIIYCSHVLEHVVDDRKAIAEFYRVLSPGGWAVLQVPIMARETYENPAIIEPEERKKHFGQWDHVRRCGPDYVERISEAGFAVQVFRGTDLAPKADCAMMGFDPNRLIFSCRKPLSDGN